MMNELQTTETEVVGQRPLFDYASLDQETQVLVRLRASEIQSLAKRVAGDIVEIGGKLAEVKDRIGGNGKFNEWLSAELGWSERTAYNFIAVWQKFGAANFALENVATSALYLLAAPSTPAEAVEVAKQIADLGEKVTHKVATAVVRQGEFTAPNAPGTTVVRATASTGNQVADVTLNVPAVITPNFLAAGPSETINWLTNIGVPVWTASAGTINSSTRVWTAPSGIGQTVQITATDGTFTATVNVLILELFPYSDFALPLSWDRRKTVLISRAEDRSRTARVKDKGGLSFESFEITMKNRTLTELNTIHDFFDRNHPGKRFILQDNLRSIRKIVYFDSDIRQSGNTRCGIDVSFRLMEA